MDSSDFIVEAQLFSWLQAHYNFKLNTQFPQQTDSSSNKRERDLEGSGEIDLHHVQQSEPRRRSLASPAQLPLSSLKLPRLSSELHSGTNMLTLDNLPQLLAQWEASAPRVSSGCTGNLKQASDEAAGRKGYSPTQLKRRSPQKSSPPPHAPPPLSSPPAAATAVLPAPPSLRAAKSKPRRVSVQPHVVPRWRQLPPHTPSAVLRVPVCSVLRADGTPMGDAATVAEEDSSSDGRPGRRQRHADLSDTLERMDSGAEAIGTFCVSPTRSCAPLACTLSAVKEGLLRERRRPKEREELDLELRL